MFPDVIKIDVKELPPVEKTRCINMITFNEENSEIKITKSNPVNESSRPQKD